MGDLKAIAKVGNVGPWGIISRVMLTVAAIVVYGWVNFLVSPVSTILIGQTASRRLV